MLDTPCPYCGHPQMPGPPDVPRPYAACPQCGKKSRAVLQLDMSGITIVRYVTTSQEGRGLIGITARIRPDQAALLAQRPNVSEIIRDALDMYLGL